MIATMERTMVNHQGLAKAMKMAEDLLAAKLRRLLVPAACDVLINIRVIIQDGGLNHIRDNEIEPAYVSHLPSREPDDEYFRWVLACAMETLWVRLLSRMIRGWHGYVVLHIAIDHGEATITSEVDGSHRP